MRSDEIERVEAFEPYIKADSDLSRTYSNLAMMKKNGKIIKSEDEDQM